MTYIQRFDPQQASDRELAEVHRFITRIRAERQPDDPPLTYEGFVANLRNVPPFIALSLWTVQEKEGGEVIARANLVIPVTEENQHLGHFDLMVLPEHRRRGIGTELLGLVASTARDIGRRLLVTSSTSTVPAAEGFLRRIGADPSLGSHSSVLTLREVDRDLMRAWQERARERASDYVMGVWEDSYPEDRLDDICTMYDAFNTMPMGDLELDDVHYTPQQIRDLEATHRARGITRWTAYVEHKDSGTIAGFTELFIDNNQPVQANQGLTAVFPEHRNRGMGRWLKAAVIEKVLAESPGTTTVATSNADVNEAMLHINREMGFKPALAEMMWQVPVERVQAYTTSRQLDIR